MPIEFPDYTLGVALETRRDDVLASRNGLVIAASDDPRDEAVIGALRLRCGF